MTPISKKIIFIAVLIAGCVLTSVFSTRNPEKALSTSLVQQSAVQSAGKKSQPKSALLRVQVSGEVLEPGIYELPKNSRVEEAVNAAGGFTENADVDKVNLVRKLRDGMQVKVPALKAGKAGVGKKAGSNVSGASGSLRSSGSVGSTRNSKNAKSAGSKQKLVGSVRINSASAKELEALPGVGPALAQRIVTERNKGRFTSADDLLRVPGIGKAKLEKMRNYIEID